MNRLIQDALKYVNSSFLIDTEIEKNVSDELPFQLKKRAELYLVDIEGREFLVLASDDPDVLSANNFLHVKKIENRFSRPLIIVTTEVNPELKAVVKQLKGGLIIPGRYTILPALLIHREVNEIPYRSNWVDTEKSFGIIPSYLICYYFSDYFSNGFSSADIIKILGISKMAVSRAVKDLVANQIIREKGSGRNMNYFFTYSRKSLWNHHRHRISMLSTGFVGVKKKHLPPTELFSTGESALSKYTLLSSPGTPNMGICMTNDERYMRPITPATINGDYFFKIMKILSDNKYEERRTDHDVMLQVFPYKPLINNGVINKVFLIFSRLNIADIRLKSSLLELETDVYNGLKD